MTEQGSRQQYQGDWWKSFASGADFRPMANAAMQIHMAGMSIWAKYWLELAQHASNYAMRYSSFPMSGYGNPSRAGDWYSRMMDDYREYLRKMAELPARAAQEFSVEAERIQREYTSQTGGESGGPASPGPQGGGTPGGSGAPGGANEAPYARKARMKD